METLALIIDVQKQLADEIREQRKDSRALSDALNRTTLEVERLSGKVEQVHRDISAMGPIFERLSKLELDNAALKTKLAIYASLAGGAGALLVTIGTTLVRVLW